MKSPAARIVAWVVAATVTAAGFIVAVVGLATPVWVAYAPDAGSIAFAGNAVLLSLPAIVGMGVCVVGLLGLSFLVGRRSVRRAPNGGHG